MLCRKLQKQLLTQHLKLYKAVLLRCPAFPANGATRVLTALFNCRESNNEGDNKRETGPLKILLFQTFCDHGQTSVTPRIRYNDNSFAHQNPSRADSYGFRVNVYVLYKDRHWSLTTSWPDALRKSMHPWESSSAASLTKCGSLFSLL